MLVVLMNLLAELHLFIYLFVHLFIYLFIHLFIYSFLSKALKPQSRGSSNVVLGRRGSTALPPWDYQFEKVILLGAPRSSK